ncbi:hypothetical protein DM02DRAFT_625235 [Periconia macrospinosa]|uniref:Uncharacterized protein n=1 Tax=Periconia macrospinosa TaxID=97972 RepID=A0A2V1E3V6_9PLEO|nr:hypothetical protein DM02DRAFT_625235 [Periconia macrospinosa]
MDSDSDLYTPFQDHAHYYTMARQSDTQHLNTQDLQDSYQQTSKQLGTEHTTTNNTPGQFRTRFAATAATDDEEYETRTRNQNYESTFLADGLPMSLHLQYPTQQTPRQRSTFDESPYLQYSNQRNANLPAQIPETGNRTTPMLTNQVPAGTAFTNDLPAEQILPGQGLNLENPFSQNTFNQNRSTTQTNSTSHVEIELNRMKEQYDILLEAYQGRGSRINHLEQQYNLLQEDYERRGLRINQLEQQLGLSENEHQRRHPNASPSPPIPAATAAQPSNSQTPILNARRSQRLSNIVSNQTADLTPHPRSSSLQTPIANTATNIRLQPQAAQESRQHPKSNPSGGHKKRKRGRPPIQRDDPQLEIYLAVPSVSDPATSNYISLDQLDPDPAAQIQSLFSQICDSNKQKYASMTAPNNAQNYIDKKICVAHLTIGKGAGKMRYFDDNNQNLACITCTNLPRPCARLVNIPDGEGEKLAIAIVPRPPDKIPEGCTWKHLEYWV